ncbi:intermembrane transport protein PqiB [Pusillimonas noertemannii]|uniref:Paraquat-inducible protein B n=1 Tax=Pusillimonas noertemannii TaxID=305977 RepID=A0A2U1CJB6_9BURK|nr:MlaD family protein [Pusillimonas noertemannii]NYT70136.1 MCE family protein [Pusillimonas noertemannii]PVY61082.1 paraquat-inducible protein B [Pusillimonas noertemannii]TFL08266.1 MCE family protein [Pusillimonas noertemannii]
MSSDQHRSEAGPEGAGKPPSGTAQGPAGHAPAPNVKPRRKAGISWIWLVPLVAVVVGLSLLVRGWMSVGPTITISFESAEGLEVGQTKIRYKDVVVGVVKDIRISQDRSTVLVKAQLNRDGSRYYTQESARYWVVRPRLGISGVSGLGTLLSGAYISVDAPKDAASGDVVTTFKGLEIPPEITSSREGRRVTLLTRDLGTLDIGSPVYFRRIKVGQVIGYNLAEDGRMVSVQVFIDAPNDRFITEDTRFWNISGINMSLGASGVEVKTGSLVSVIAGGIAFASINPFNTAPAPEDATFTLADNESEAMAEPDGPPFRIDMIFRQSVRGLKLGAPVDFRGMQLGEVYDIDLEFDEKEKRFHVLVKAHLYPLRFGGAYDRLSDEQKAASYPANALLGPLVKHGLRAQIKAANLLTGQQYIALDFVRDAEPAEIDPQANPMVLPTVTGSFDKLQEQLSNVVAKLDAVPFDGIGKELHASLASLHRLLDGMDGLGPQLGGTLKAARQSLQKVERMLDDDSPMNTGLEDALRELGNAAKSLRALGDYLQTHPSALLRGRPADVLPTP